MGQNTATWGNGYAMTPGWLLLRRPSPNALTLYVHLAMHGRFDHGTGTYEECRPSIKRLSQGDPKSGYPGTGMSPATIHRALRELIKLGAIEGTQVYSASGGQLPTVYRVHFGRVAPPEAAESSGGGVTSDMGGVSPVREHLEPPTQNHLPTSPPTPRADPAGAAVAEQAEAGRQEKTGDQNQAATTDLAPDRAAAELVDALEWPGTIDRARITASRRNLITAAASALAAGHHPDAVRATAAEAMPGALTPGAVVARLRDLATRTPDPAVAAAAERRAAAQARERMRRTPHQWVDDPRRPYYCKVCGQFRAIHRCEHGRRVCVTCHGGRRNDTTGSTSTPARPAPRQRPATGDGAMSTLGSVLAAISRLHVDR